MSLVVTVWNDKDGGWHWLAEDSTKGRSIAVNREVYETQKAALQSVDEVVTAFRSEITVGVTTLLPGTRRTRTEFEPVASYDAEGAHERHAEDG